MMVTATDMVFVVSPMAVAVTLTVMFAVTVAGALYIADVVVTLVKVPHAAPVQPLPVRVQVTPWLDLSLATAAVKLFCCPWAMLSAVPGVSETLITGVVGALLLLPHPENENARAMT